MVSNATLNTTSSPASTGVLVAVAVAFGSVAVCAPVPTLTKHTFGPSLMILIVLPTAGRAVEVLAVAVTLMGLVRHCTDSGFADADILIFS